MDIGSLRQQFDADVSAAVFASLANDAGDEIASSDRLLRSSVLPAAFSPAMNWP